MHFWPQRRRQELLPRFVRPRPCTGSDPLTSLPTFDIYQTALRQEWDSALRLHRPLSLIKLSADDFADYNDEHGREAGDGLLLYLAQELSATGRRFGHDMVARLMGTHFAVILPNTSAPGALSFARRFRARIQASGRLHAADHLTIRVSIATLRPDHRATWNELELEALAHRGLALTEQGDPLVSLTIAGPTHAHLDA